MLQRVSMSMRTAVVRAAVSCVHGAAAPRASVAALQLQQTRRPVAPSARSFSASAAAVNASEHPIVVERRDKGVVVVRFNRPSSFNAMTVQMGEQFQAAMAQLGQDKEVRVVILTGEGKAFSAGGDLDFLLNRANDEPGNNAPMMRAFYARFLSLLQLPVPVIAAINGPAIGAGMCVAAACDLRIAAKTTDMGFTFAKLGLHPGMGSTHVLPALIGQENASRLLLTGEIIQGPRALEMGLVGEVVETAADVFPAALRLAESIAANPPMCIRTLTTSLRMVHQQNMERALWREADAQSQTYATAEFKNNVTAMMNKTKKPKKQ